MNKNPIEEYIRQEGLNETSIFVFPSDIAASLWRETALSITKTGTLPSDRFIAWDRFKEDAVKASVLGKTPVSSLLRKLYSLNFTMRNAESVLAQDKPFLSTLIPPKYAADGSLFSKSLARILPQLALWELKLERKNKSLSPSLDAEEMDMALLKSDYSQFLHENNLFEPSWQKPPLSETGFQYYIFFPEAIEDFTEYATLLRSAPFIHLIEAPLSSEPVRASIFENTREEFRSISLSIEELLRKGISPESIAISVPDIETAAPYLLRELTLRSIPFEFRSGETIASLSAGRFFPLIQDCVSASFAFAPLKALMLNRLIPWKNRNLAEDLVEFGIRNHCVTSWKENDTHIDIWEEAFKTPNKSETSDWMLRDWYRKLKTHLEGLVSCRCFSDIRTKWFIFRNEFLDITLLDEKDDAILARCIEELKNLVALESRFTTLIPQNPFSFFVSVLEDTPYVRQREKGGVSIFPYRVAAGTPFAHHFIPDASQNTATVLYSQLSFLRQDKRLDLLIQDMDASAVFFNIYHSSGSAYFSFSNRTFGGYHILHGYFSREKLSSGDVKNESSLLDPYEAERLHYSGGLIPDRLHPLQKKGLAAWDALALKRGFSYLKEPFTTQVLPLCSFIQNEKHTNGNLRVSQTDLGIFSVCNARWFLSRVLNIEVLDSDAELMNERNLGLLYHNVLKDLYTRIRDTDGSFSASNIATYRSWAKEIAGGAASGHAEFKGPLAAPIIDSLVQKITAGVCGMLEKDCELLDGFIPEFLEDDIAFSLNGIYYNGKIDRISRRNSDNTLVLIDYKSGKPPRPVDYATENETMITDFQIPMYLFLTEESPQSPYKGQPVEYAWFGSIKEGDYRPIINGEDLSHGRKKGMISREEFEPAMEAFQKMTLLFSQAVKECNFTKPKDLSWSVCNACEFKRICRTTYSVRP